MFFDRDSGDTLGLCGMADLWDSERGSGCETRRWAGSRRSTVSAHRHREEEFSLSALSGRPFQVDSHNTTGHGHIKALGMPGTLTMLDHVGNDSEVTL